MCMRAGSMPIHMCMHSVTQEMGVQRALGLSQQNQLLRRAVHSGPEPPFILVYVLSCKVRAENSTHTHKMQYEHFRWMEKYVKWLRTKGRDLNKKAFSISRLLSKEGGVGDRSCLHSHSLPTQLPSSRPLSDLRNLTLGSEINRQYPTPAQ